MFDGCSSLLSLLDITKRNNNKLKYKMKECLSFFSLPDISKWNPDLDYLNNLANINDKKDYLGEYLFIKIEHHPITQKQNLGIETIVKITGMILDIEDIEEIYNITINNNSIGERIEEALSLLEGS